jgi:hypothetical protein
MPRLLCVALVAAACAGGEKKVALAPASPPDPTLRAPL